MRKTRIFEFKLPLAPSAAPEKCAQDYLLSACPKDIGYIEKIYSCDVTESRTSSDGKILHTFRARILTLLPSVGGESSAVVEICSKNEGIILKTGRMTVGIPLRFMPDGMIFKEGFFLDVSTSPPRRIGVGTKVTFQVVAIRYQMGGWKAVGRIVG